MPVLLVSRPEQNQGTRWDADRVREIAEGWAITILAEGPGWRVQVLIALGGYLPARALILAEVQAQAAAVRKPFPDARGAH